MSAPHKVYDEVYDWFLLIFTAASLIGALWQMLIADNWLEGIALLALGTSTKATYEIREMKREAKP